MSFQTPRSIEEMLTAIHKRDYLMPAIQRLKTNAIGIELNDPAAHQRLGETTQLRHFEKRIHGQINVELAS